MAGIWADFPSGSHGLYGSNDAAMNNGVWSDIGGVGQVAATIDSDPDPSIGSAGRVLYGAAGGNSRGKRFVLPSTQATVGVALNQWLSSIPNSSVDIVIMTGWRSAGNSTIGYVYIDTSGRIAYFNRFDNTDIAITSGPVVTPNAWWHIESKLTCGTSSDAEIEVRVNGVTVLTHTGFTTGTSTSGGAIAGTSQIIINKINGGGSITRAHWKNIVFWDGSGGEVNDFQGSVTVFFNPVDLDITTGGWTLSSGSNASALIGHVGPPADANYISADDSPPAPAELQITDLPPDITSIRFVVPVVRAAKVDGGDGNLQISLTPNGTDYVVGPDTPVTTAFTYWGNSTYPFVSHVNPQTASAWTPADFTLGVRLRINRTV